MQETKNKNIQQTKQFWLCWNTSSPWACKSLFFKRVVASRRLRREIHALVQISKTFRVVTVLRWYDGKRKCRNGKYMLQALEKRTYKLEHNLKHLKTDSSCSVTLNC